MKIFKESGASSAGKVLTHSEFLEKSGWRDFDITPDKAEGIIRKAEAYLDTEIPMLTLSMYHDFFVSGSRQPFVSNHMLRREIISTLTFAEHIEKSGRFISKICDALWSVLEETTWVIPAHIGHNPTGKGCEYPPVYNETDMHGVDLYAANTCCALALPLLLLRGELDAVSPILAERTEYELEKRIFRPFLSFHHSYTGAYGDKCNNWVTHVVECVLFAAAVVEKRQHAREAIVARSMSYLDNYTTWMPDDGGCDEGPGYWNGAAASYYVALEQIYDMTGGEVNVFSHPLIRAMGEYIYKFNINGQKFINFADCSPNVYPDGYLIARYGERCGSEGMIAFGRMMMERMPHMSYIHPYRTIRALPVPYPEDAEVTKADKYVWYPNLKVMIARDSEDTSKGLFLAIKGGHNKQSHNHNDVGSYIVYNNGQPSVIDPGNVVYTREVFGPNRYKIWAMQSHYHNLPAFDGYGEPSGIVYASNRESYNEDTHTVSLGLEMAFDRNIGIERYTRSAHHEDGLIEISEDIVLASEREIDFRIMTHAMPKVLGEGRLALPGGVTMEYDTRLAYEAEEFDPVGGSSEAKWGTPVLYRLHFTVRAKEFKCKFKYTATK